MEKREPEKSALNKNNIIFELRCGSISPEPSRDSEGRNVCRDECRRRQPVRSSAVSP
jgi:hypothetical protein